MLEYADGSFNTILELGFASSIRKEWEWRVSRGEPTRNLEAFRGPLALDELARPPTSRAAGRPGQPSESGRASAVEAQPRAPGRRAGRGLAPGDGDADQGEHAAGVRHRGRRLAEEDQPSTIVIGGTR